MGVEVYKDNVENVSVVCFNVVIEKLVEGGLPTQTLRQIREDTLPTEYNKLPIISYLWAPPGEYWTFRLDGYALLVFHG